jgi:hypothetical protein
MDRFTVAHVIQQLDGCLENAAVPVAVATFSYGSHSLSAAV